ncbi:hypothetical protein COCMIDRAFT_99842 [Bipolaris oryzae ATCC 44560]|uniref:Uncharacterized protein n=1 Tax=Bipolaris oryzae ATCC 44560 TaxID=930090 RepID=W6Z1J5_COCMI|nr:uncharacterized protein COCMIDRAFT_99842 [Bipolaris oryzae ATCC 44560]EUC43815.1 hypothetical protein COCMIDRAFT_99842 [Bipolaris oryzae ATCC 44560]
MPAQSENVLWRAKQFFAERLGDRRARLDYLFRAVQGLVEAPGLAQDFAENMWKSRSAIFNKPSMPNTKARLRSLYDGHRTIKRAREQYLYAARFCYIYLEHDLDELSKSRDLILSQGRGRITAAFELQAEIISTTVEVVKAERKAGRGYLQILMEGGPGFILRLGSNVSTIWERKLSTADIRLIIEFLMAEAPVLYNDIISYNELATRALIDGFIAYGWSPEEILASETSLFNRLREFANLEDIVQSAQRCGPSQSLGNTPSEMGKPKIVQNQDFCSLDEEILSTPHSNLPFVALESVFELSTCTGEELEAINSLSQTRDEELELLLSQELEYSTNVCWALGDENLCNIRM